MSLKISKLRLDNLSHVEPLTLRQGEAFKEWNAGNNLILNGSAGTGKTFLSIYLAFKEVLDPKSYYDKVVIIRSVVPTRQMGYLPGTLQEKTEVYTKPYVRICEEIFDDPMAWQRLQSHRAIEFESTSFLRGTTFENAIVIMDEMQNMDGRELNTIITRVGYDCRLIACGDYYQTDLLERQGKGDILTFLNVLRRLENFSVVEFGHDDIVRSDLVRDYIIMKETMGVGTEW